MRSDAGDDPRVMVVVRTLFLVVAVVAGIAGVMMIAAANETDRYFSWPIGPPPLAATVGGFYVASAVVFGLAASRGTWSAARGLCVGVLALTIPTLVATVRHQDVFDFGRWQAVAWVVFFVASPSAFGTILVLHRRPRGRRGHALRPWARGLLVTQAVLYGLLALGLWFDPSRAAPRSPFALPGMGVRFLGCWAAFLATMATYAVIRDRAGDTRAPMLALVLWPTGGLVAALLNFDELAPAGRRAGYVVTLVALVIISAAVLLAGTGEPGALRASPRGG